MLAFPIYGLNDLIKKVRSENQNHSSELRVTDEKDIIFNAWATVFKKQEQQLIFIRLYNITSEKNFKFCKMSLLQMLVMN